MLKEIRAFLRRIGANALVIAHDDEYQNETLSPDKERLAYVTGFTGSAGLAVITPRQAVLFVDGRYVEQAKKQTKFKVYHVPRQRTVGEWFTQFLRPNYIVAYDPWCHTVRQINAWSEIFAKRGAQLVPYTPNPIDKFWLTRPQPKPVHVFDYPKELAGQTTKQKISPVKRVLRLNGLDAFVVTAPDTVSWLLNKRSDAVAYAPVYLDRLIVWASGEIMSWTEDNVRLLKGKIIGVDPNECSVKIKQDATNAGASVHLMPNPFLRQKAVKNKTEIRGMQEAGLLDSIALCQFFARIAKHPQKGTELSVLPQLEMFRRQSLLYRENSFAPISAVGRNAALPHYASVSGKEAALKGGILYLLDSGAHYWCGTTDVTRTVALAKPTALMKQRYTQVLKGHIDLAKAIFPQGTSGAQLDVLARRPLWNEGLDYDHGTGHGIGCFLNVHETPPTISKYGNEPLLPGMIVSNEPGFYARGKFGIRIENMMMVVKEKKGRKGFFAFEMLTYLPFCDELMDEALLSEEEKQWISDYYTEMVYRIYPRLDDETQKWMKKQVRRWIRREGKNSTSS